MHLGIYIQSNLSCDKQVSSNVMKENPKLSITNSVKGPSMAVLGHQLIMEIWSLGVV